MDRFGNRVSTVARKYDRGRLDKKCVSFRVLQEVYVENRVNYEINHELNRARQLMVVSLIIPIYRTISKR
jgi:hypothetical protein